MEAISNYASDRYSASEKVVASVNVSASVHVYFYLVYRIYTIGATRDCFAINSNRCCLGASFLGGNS